MSERIIEVEHLSRSFGNKRALKNINLDVRQGTVLGLVGENGAGKTTLIKHLLGLLIAKQGKVRVFGIDPARCPAKVLGRIGFMSEERVLPRWMTIGELIRYTQAFYPDWDRLYAGKLLDQFDLDPTQKIKSLSRGQRAKTGLLIALAYRPDLLLFDEPSSGLDPIVRRDILGAIVQTVAYEGRTVLLSSHLLDEVERISSHLAIIHQGEVVVADSMATITSKYHKMTIRSDSSQEDISFVPGSLLCEGVGPERTFFFCGDAEQLKAYTRKYDGRILDVSSPSLDELFYSIVKSPHIHRTAV